MSPWVAEGAVFNEEYRHTSLIATLREQWSLGAPFTDRDAAARTFSSAFTLDVPRDPKTWPDPAPRPVPKFTLDALAFGTVVSPLGKHLLDGLRAYAQHHNIEIEGLPADPDADVPVENVLEVLQNSMAMFFPRLAPTAPKT